MSTTTYGCRVTKENVNLIINHVSEFQLNVDYLKDNFEYHTEDGVALFAIFSCNDDTGSATFTEMTEAGFRSTWQFRHPENFAAPWLQIIDHLK